MKRLYKILNKKKHRNQQYNHNSCNCHLNSLNKLIEKRINKSELFLKKNVSDIYLKKIQDSNLDILEKFNLLFDLLEIEKQKKIKLINTGTFPLCKECFSDEYSELYIAYNNLLKPYNIDIFLAADTGYCIFCGKITEVFIPKSIRFFTKEIFPLLKNKFKNNSEMFKKTTEEILFEEIRKIQVSSCLDRFQKKIKIH